MSKLWRGWQLSLALVGINAGVVASDFYVPETISNQAQAAIRQFSFGQRDSYTTPPATDLAAWQKMQQPRNNQLATQQLLDTFQAHINARFIDQVPVVDVYPQAGLKNGRVILYLHGGAYTFGSAIDGLNTAVPVAAASKLHIIVVDYALAPHHPWPAAQNQVIKVYRQLLKSGVRAQQIAFFGDSAGGGLACSTILRLQNQRLPVPGALVLWSPWADISGVGDSYHTLKDDEPMYTYQRQLKNSALAYTPAANQHNPYVSPVYGNYQPGFSPTLIQGGTKEIFLSDFVRLYQNLDQSGVRVKLDLYEGMWHVFAADYNLPEAIIARNKMVNFLQANLHYKL